MQLKTTTLGWILDLCQFLTSCPGNGSKKVRKMAYLAMATIFADSNDTKSDEFQTTPTFQAVSRWTWVEMTH